MKQVIYQLLPRTFVNYNTARQYKGTKENNGCGKLNDITPTALNAIRDLGVTHVWYTGIIEHATASDYTAYGIAKDNPDIVKGLAGSPYAIKDYYDIDPDLAVDVPNRMHEFEQLVERTHAAGLKVVLDFVPNHVARQYRSDAKPLGISDLGSEDNSEWAFSPLNNFYYLPTDVFRRGSYEEYPAKATGNDCFSAYPSDNDWYETVKLNYGVFYTGGMEKQFEPIPSTWKKMLEILLFWASKGIDAFRCDMAEMVPVEFWGWAIELVKKSYPNLDFIGEIYRPNLYRTYLHDGRFDYLYDKIGMYEYLRGATSKNFAVEGISAQWQATDDIRDRMLYFLENHDEQRIASGFFCGRGICAEPAMIVAATLGTNPVLIYAGQELGEKGMDCEGFSGMDGRTTIFDYWGIKSIQAWANNGKFDGANLSEEEKALQTFYRTLLNLASKHPAITEGKMYDLEYAQMERFNRHEQFVYLRGEGNKVLLVVTNFDDHEVSVHINIPEEARAYMGMTKKFTQGQDLLTSKRVEDIYNLTLPAWTGMIIELD